MPRRRRSLEQPGKATADADHGQPDEKYRHDKERHAVFVVMLFDILPSGLHRVLRASLVSARFANQPSTVTFSVVLPKSVGEKKLDCVDMV
jgi:hypothetical protein